MFGFWPILSGEVYHCFWIKEIWHRSPIKSHNFFLPNRERKPVYLIQPAYKTGIQFKHFKIQNGDQVQTFENTKPTLGFTISRDSAYSILFYCTIEKCHFSSIFYISKGHYEIKFMSRKISISKKPILSRDSDGKDALLKTKESCQYTFIGHIFAQTAFS